MILNEKQQTNEYRRITPNQAVSLLSEELMARVPLTSAVRSPYILYSVKTGSEAYTE
jgi:hypothetical protein